jgi:hypothetical protein
LLGGRPSIMVEWSIFTIGSAKMTSSQPNKNHIKAGVQPEAAGCC